MKDAAVKSASVKPARASAAHHDPLPAAPALSRRRFVTMVAAGSAALLAAPAGSDARARTKRTSTPAPKPEPPAPAPSKFEKELARQRTGTLATLKLVRDYPLPPGGDLPVVFRPQRTRTRGR